MRLCRYAAGSRYLSRRQLQRRRLMTTTTATTTRTARQPRRWWWWWCRRGGVMVVVQDSVPQYGIYRNAKLLRHRQRGRPGPVAGFKARSSQVELPNARALYFSLSLTPTSRAHTRRMKFCLGRDRDRLISSTSTNAWPMAQNPRAIASSLKQHIIYLVWERRMCAPILCQKFAFFPVTWS